MKTAALLCALAAAGAAFPQAMVEYSLTTGASSNASAGMKAAGEGIAKALGKAAQTLQQGQAAAQSSLVRLPASAKGGEPVKLAAVPDRSKIKPGMDAAQLERDCGAPSMKISGPESVTWWYASSTDSVAVEVLSGKVVSVSPPKPPDARDATATLKPKTGEEKSPAADTGVVILQ
jgi:hypothetical protein